MARLIFFPKGYFKRRQSKPTMRISRGPDGRIVVEHPFDRSEGIRAIPCEVMSTPNAWGPIPQA
jgi:hypothetical protein